LGSLGNTRAAASRDAPIRAVDRENRISNLPTFDQRLRPAAAGGLPEPGAKAARRLVHAAGALDGERTPPAATAAPHVDHSAEHLYLVFG
jgi:hypothetical protein